MTAQLPTGGSVPPIVHGVKVGLFGVAVDPATERVKQVRRTRLGGRRIIVSPVTGVTIRDFKVTNEH